MKLIGLLVISFLHLPPAAQNHPYPPATIIEEIVLASAIPPISLNDEYAWRL